MSKFIDRWCCNSLLKSLFSASIELHWSKTLYSSQTYYIRHTDILFDEKMHWLNFISKLSDLFFLIYNTLHSEAVWTHWGFRLDVSRNLPRDGQNFRTLSGNRVPKRKIRSDIPILNSRRLKFSPDVVSFYAKKILFVMVRKIFGHI